MAKIFPTPAKYELMTESYQEKDWMYSLFKHLSKEWGAFIIFAFQQFDRHDIVRRSKESLNEILRR